MLFLSFPLGDCLGVFQQAVGQGRFAMIDVGDNGEVTGEFDGHGRIVKGEGRIVKNDCFVGRGWR